MNGIYVSSPIIFKKQDISFKERIAGIWTYESPRLDNSIINPKIKTTKIASVFRYRFITFNIIICYQLVSIQENAGHFDPQIYLIFIERHPNLKPK